MASSSDTRVSTAERGPKKAEEGGKASRFPCRTICRATPWAVARDSLDGFAVGKRVENFRPWSSLEGMPLVAEDCAATDDGPAACLFSSQKKEKKKKEKRERKKKKRKIAEILNLNIY